MSAIPLHTGPPHGVTSSPEPFMPVRTQALVVEKPGAKFTMQDVVWEHMRDDEVLVEMKYTGLCHTDVAVQLGHIPFGDYPAILGHEGAGVVRRVGSAVKDRSLKESDTVVLSFVSCNACPPCSRGNVASCTAFNDINFAGTSAGEGSSPSLASSTAEGPIRAQFFGQSAFSRFAVVHERSIVKYDLTDQELSVLAPLGCGYQTGAGTVFNVIQPSESSTIAIIGAGGVGCAALMAAKASNAKRIVVLDHVASKLELAKSLGATDVINTSESPDMAAAIRSILPDGVDGVVDTTGLPKLVAAGIRSLAQQGILTLLGVPPPGSSLEIDPYLVMIRCLRIVGVIEGGVVPGKMIPKLIELYRQGKFPIDRLSKVYPIAAIDTAIADMKAGRVIKPVLSWERVENKL